MALSLTESPILIENLQFKTTFSYAGNDTAQERQPVDPSDVWFEFIQIPETPPAQSAFPGTPDGANIVSGISGVVLTAVPESLTRFQSLLGYFSQMVPSSTSGGAYRPTLRDANGVEVKFDPSVWIADGLLRVVEFVNGIPDGLVAPFTLAYWQYIGQIAAGTGALANEGGGPGRVYDSVVGNVAVLRTLDFDPTAGSEGISVSTSGQKVLIGNTLTADNLPVASGVPVFSSKVGNVLEFRQLLAGTGITISQSANAITLSTGIAPSPASFMNEGGGAGQIFDTVVGTVVMFRTVDLDPTVGNEGIVVATTGGGLVTVGNTLTGANVGAGAQLFSAKTAGALLQFRSLIAAGSSGLTLTQNANDITISAANGAVVNTLANEGAGTGSIFDSTVSNVANLRTLIADATTANLGIAIATGATTVTISNTLTGANVGAGSQLFAAKVGGALLNFRSLIAAGSSGLTLTQNANDITVSATAGAVVTALANEGAGTGSIFDAIVGNTANLRTLIADAATANLGIAITTGSTTVTISNTLTGANVGAGAQLFSAKVGGALLNFRSLIAAGSTGLTLTQNASDITVSATAGAVVTALANEGAGTGLIFDSIVGNTANLRTLLIDPTVGSEGIAIATGATTISIGNTLTAANVGAGSQLFATKTAGAVLQFRSLIAAASSGLTLTQNANDITISAIAGTGITALANEGAGTGSIFDAIVGHTANLRTLLIDPTVGNEGVAIATGATTVSIGNTLTAANVGAGSQLFATKTAGAVLQFRSLIAAASSNLVLTQNANDITIAGAASFTTGALSCSSINNSGTSALAGVVTCSNTTDASSTVLAGVVMSGGLGVAKTLFVGTGINNAGAMTMGTNAIASVGAITSSGAFSNGTNALTSGALGAASLNISGTSTLAGVVTCSNTTDASSTVLAGVVMSGGLGVAKTLFVGTGINNAGAMTMGTNAITSVGAITSSGTFSNGTNSMMVGAITSSGTFSNGTNAMTTGAITSSGAFSNGTNAMTTGAITSSGAFSNGTNAMTTGALSAASIGATTINSPTINTPTVFSNVIAITGNTTATNAQAGSVYLLNNNSGVASTLTLPTSPTTGWHIRVFINGASTANWTIASGSSNIFASVNAAGTMQSGTALASIAFVGNLQSVGDCLFIQQQGAAFLVTGECSLSGGITAGSANQPTFPTVINITNTTDSSSAGAGSINTAGGIYSAKSLHFAQATANRKVVLFEDAANDHQFYGLGLQAGILRYQVGSSATDHVFYCGASSSTSTELMRIKGTGQLNIPTTTDATTTGTGTIVTAGGIGVAGTVFTNDLFANNMRTSVGVQSSASLFTLIDSSSVFQAVTSNAASGNLPAAPSTGRLFSIHAAFSSGGPLSIGGNGHNIIDTNGSSLSTVSITAATTKWFIYDSANSVWRTF